MAVSAPEAMTEGQKQTLAARKAFAARFPDEEPKREHFRGLAQKANAARLMLSISDRAEADEALAVLTRILTRKS